MLTRQSNLMIVLMFSLCSAFASISLIAQPVYKRIKLCDLDSSTSLHKLVAVDADLIFAFPHGIVLTDDSCLRKGLSVEFPPREKEDQSLVDLEKKLFNLPLPGRQTGIFFGEIKRDRKTKKPTVLFLHFVRDLRPKNSEIHEPETPGPIALLEELSPPDLRPFQRHDEAGGPGPRGSKVSSPTNDGCPGSLALGDPG